jgi:hypothetical protein
MNIVPSNILWETLFRERVQHLSLEDEQRMIDVENMSQAAWLKGQDRAPRHDAVSSVPAAKTAVEIVLATLHDDLMKKEYGR